MPYPTLEQVYDMFKLFEDPPEGSKRFFRDFVSPSVEFHAVGPPGSPHAAVYRSRDEFMAGGFGKLSRAVHAPGMKFRVVDGVDGVTVDEGRGRAAAMFDAVDTVTHGGTPYRQRYSWHVRFGEDGLITHVFAYLDHGYLDRVLGAELKRLGIE